MTESLALDSVPVQFEMETASAIKLMARTHEGATEAIHAGEKVAILRQQLLEKERISKLCDEVGLQATVFYSLARFLAGGREKQALIGFHLKNPLEGSPPAEVHDARRRTSWR